MSREEGSGEPNTRPWMNLRRKNGGRKVVSMKIISRGNGIGEKHLRRSLACLNEEERFLVAVPPGQWGDGLSVIEGEERGYGGVEGNSPREVD